MKQGIHLVLWLDDQQRIHKFELSGHAGYAEYGQDIVCAAVSALSISAVNGLEHFLPQQPEVEVRDTDGYLTCSLPNLDLQTLEQAQWILKTMVLGIEEIQRNYGNEYLKLTQRRWTPC